MANPLLLLMVNRRIQSLGVTWDKNADTIIRTYNEETELVYGVRWDKMADTITRIGVT